MSDIELRYIIDDLREAAERGGQYYQQDKAKDAWALVEEVVRLRKICGFAVPMDIQRHLDEGLPKPC